MQIVLHFSCIFSDRKHSHVALHFTAYLLHILCIFVHNFNCIILHIYLIAYLFLHIYPKLIGQGFLSLADNLFWYLPFASSKHGILEKAVPAVTEEDRAEMYAATTAEHNEEGAHEQLAAGWKKRLAVQNPTAAAGVTAFAAAAGGSVAGGPGPEFLDYWLLGDGWGGGAAGKARWRPGGAGQPVGAGRPWRRSGVAIPEQIRMSLQAMKSAH